MRKQVTHGKISQLTGETNYMSMAYDERDYSAWKAGTPIQDAMPYLTADEREFLMTGITPEEWESAFDKHCSSLVDLSEEIFEEIYA